MLRNFISLVLFVLAIVVSIQTYAVSASAIQDYAYTQDLEVDRELTFVSFSNNASHSLIEEVTRCTYHLPVLFKSAYKYCSTKLAMSDFDSQYLNHQYSSFVCKDNQFTQLLFSSGVSSFLPYIRVFQI